MKYKSLIIFGVGVAVGALGTWKFFDKKCEEQISAMENVLKNSNNDDEKKDSENTDSIFSAENSDDKENEEKEETPKPGVEVETSSIDMDRIKDFKDSVNIIGKNNYDTPMPPQFTVTKETEEEMAEKEHPTEDEFVYKEPYLIGTEEWEENPSQYEKVEVTLYEDGALVADDTDELIDVDCIGMKNFQLYTNTDPAATIMYVRNEQLMTDYEVDYLREPWFEMQEAKVPGGFEPPEPERGEDADEFEYGYYLEEEKEGN